MAKVDAKIRRIKETYRSVKAGLAWKVPSSWVNDLLPYYMSMLNLRRTSALHVVTCPTFIFTGVKPMFKKVFGSKERSLACIALYPVGNATGRWMFWNMSTKRLLRRSN